MNTRERVDNRAYCACLRVEYAPRHNDDGSATERWACPLCGGEFVRRFWHDRMEQRARDAERERDVCNGTWCATNMDEGRGPCGTCIRCLRTEGNLSEIIAARDVENATLRAECDALRADLRALVPLARWALNSNDSQDWPEDIAIEQTAAARAILDRVAGEEGA